MTTTINRTEQCIPWSVFARQLDSHHLCGDLCIGLCTVALKLLVLIYQQTLKACLSSPCTGPDRRGFVSVQS